MPYKDSQKRKEYANAYYKKHKDRLVLMNNNWKVDNKEHYSTTNHERYKRKGNVQYRLSKRINGKQIGEHVYVWLKENTQGMYVIPKNWVVHHIDGNPQNNGINNLACIPKNVHQEIHEVIKNGTYVGKTKR